MTDLKALAEELRIATRTGDHTISMILDLCDAIDAHVCVSRDGQMNDLAAERDTALRRAEIERAGAAASFSVLADIRDYIEQRVSEDGAKTVAESAKAHDAKVRAEAIDQCADVVNDVYDGAESAATNCSFIMRKIRALKETP